ncbi:MAG: glutamate--cysteine ligase [Gammaproteobacteria bacterium]|nr:hypothetical protein [Pseudomonadales bacterium]MCP5345779.1 glutamate--cysteine ligase [Pseudomonadales bacterium]
MGRAIEKIEFEEEDYQRFSRRLRENLEVLRLLLERPGFGSGPASFGAELEMYLIDGEGNALCENREIQQLMNNPQLTLELNRFNLEYNLTPFPMANRPFSESEKELLGAMSKMQECASAVNGRVVPIGILPTLRTADFNEHTMTDVPRYHALANRLKRDKPGSFRIQIKGQDELHVESNDITLEGANTSFQVHYRVSPEAYADTFNALQLVTPLVLAIASNSPIVFGERLWHETRIPLFKKSIDTRKDQLLMNAPWHQLPRVNFGNGWVRQGILEQFAETVHLYPVLLPIIDDEDSLAVVESGGIPRLSELRLQQSTVWLWNRPIYDDASGGHLRIELRALPSGPSVVDMMANAALAIGLAEGLRTDINRLITALPFSYANHNFYRAAEFGIHSRILWPDPDASELMDHPVLELLQRLLPVAESGLRSIGVESADINYYLGIIGHRIEKGISGAEWQLRNYDALRRKHNSSTACRILLERYYQQSRANLPVAEWEYK